MGFLVRFQHLENTVMKLELLALVALFATCQAISFFEVVAEEWETWKVNHGKNYSDTMEEKFRLKIFMENNGREEPGPVRLLLGLLHHRFPRGSAFPQDWKALVPQRAEPGGLLPALGQQRLQRRPHGQC